MRKNTYRIMRGGYYNTADDIAWGALPESFALKCTHGCGFNVVVKEKNMVSEKETKDLLNSWLRKDFGYRLGEWHYLGIPHRIISEKYYGTDDGELPVDYKLFCLNGRVACTLVCTERTNGLKLVFMDNNWERLRIDTANLPDSYIQEKPKTFSLMKEYAERLSQPFPFVRVDFYEYHGKPILSELTFTPAYNCMFYLNEKGQKLLGDKLII